MNMVAFDFEVLLQRVLERAYGLIAAVPMLLVALAVVLCGWWLGRWVSRHALFDRMSNRNPFLRALARTTAQWLITGVALLLALQLMDATALVGAVLGTTGVLGIAIGFAFKDTLENYLAGFLMSLRRPFAPRDHVVIDGNEGLVISMNARATILMTPDGNHLRLPNALVFRSVMLNYTRNPNRRFDFDVGIGVQEDLAHAQRICVAELGRVSGVLRDPPPRSFIAALADSNVQVRFLAWVDQRSHDFMSVKSEAIRGVKLALEEQGMDMPEPIYRLQISDRRADTAPASAPVARRAPARGEAIDTRAVDDLQAQIDHCAPAGGAPDLLDARAPKE